jgi:hypothetical protein
MKIWKKTSMMISTYGKTENATEEEQISPVYGQVISDKRMKTFRINIRRKPSQMSYSCLCK